MGLSTIVVLIAIVIAWLQFRRPKFGEEKGIGKLFAEKWYVDELYDKIIVRPILWLGDIFDRELERSGIDALVNGVGKAVQYGSRQLRWLQSGQVGSYVLLMVISMVLFLVFQFFLRK
jgi:NADH-quinone oxidoreductase subunit L